tara:strand:- start:1485 stop:2348 length:864 start_codon:yes stop_codon:yes gene_type:complete
MRKIKLFFSFISILVIIYFIIVYALLKYINNDDILSYIEKDLNIVVEKINTKIFPVVEISTDVTRINNENVIANNISLILSQPHLITFGNLDLKIDEMFINNLVFDNINVYGKVNYISNYLNDIDNLDNILNGTYIITSNLSLKTTNEEKFLISFLKLFFEKIENNRNDNFALSTLLKVLNENKSILKGSITKEKNIFFSNDLLIQNEDNKILVSGIYNFLDSEIKLDLDLEQDGVIYISAEIFGKINSPKIKIDKDSKFLKNINQNNNLLEENVMQFLNSFLGIND